MIGKFQANRSYSWVIYFARVLNYVTYRGLGVEKDYIHFKKKNGLYSLSEC